MEPNRHRTKTWLIAAAAATGLALGAAGVAGAATQAKLGLY